MHCSYVQLCNCSALKHGNVVYALRCAVMRCVVMHYVVMHYVVHYIECGIAHAFYTFLTLINLLKVFLLYFMAVML